jgi:biotin-(acetyl-CoA carboxylase) ligase
VGVGLNVNQERGDLPADVKIAAASLYTSDGIKRDRAPLLAAIVSRFEHNYDAWVERGLDGVYDSLGSRDFLRGRRIDVDGEPGSASRSTGTGASSSTSAASSAPSSQARSPSSAS